MTHAERTVIEQPKNLLKTENVELERQMPGAEWVDSLGLQLSPGTYLPIGKKLMSAGGESSLGLPPINTHYDEHRTERARNS